MEKFVLVIHTLIGLSIVVLILLQQGKGATAGASFGSGASQTVFGSQGSFGFFTRLTAIFAVIFFATSFGLAIIAKNKADVDDIGIPALIETRQIQETDVPAVDNVDDNGIPEVPAN